MNCKCLYLEKTKDISDPYVYSTHNLNDEILPPVRNTDIFNYLVLMTSFCTDERFKADRSFDSFKYFLNGFVGSTAGIRKAEDYIVLGKMW